MPWNALVKWPADSVVEALGEDEATDITVFATATSMALNRAAEGLENWIDKWTK